MLDSIFELLQMIALDALFTFIILLALIPLRNFNRPAFAVLKRNFFGYFNDPIGYAFLCFFVLLTSLAAFMPDDFFNNNMANLAQLNKYLPAIMLLFVPAITMSIWSDETRQGTDELLLTMPATDLDIVLGKYIAAALIFTTSLLFSQISNYVVLVALTRGDLDTGLVFTTYLGYWFMGLSMLSVGMVASFLTRNLTISFILAALFNAPLALVHWAGWFVSDQQSARALERWSYLEQFSDFGRGVISASSVTFFVMIVILGLYLSMVLIGRRHWMGHEQHSRVWTLPVFLLATVIVPAVCLIGAFMCWNMQGAGMAVVGFVLTAVACVSVFGFLIYDMMQADSRPFRLGHFTSRAFWLVAIAVGLNFALSNYDLFRYDTTEGQVSSLSPDTYKLLRELEPEHTIYVDAYISNNIPENYASVRFDMISMLREFKSTAGKKVEIRLHTDIDPKGDEAIQAEQRYGITSQNVVVDEGSRLSNTEVLLGAAFSCGLERVIVPFFDYGVPVEYELVRSISTVAKGDRPTIGFIATDAKLFGDDFQMTPSGPVPIPKQEIITELEKQYDVEKVDPASPIDTKRYKVLLVVQPSSLPQRQLENVMDAIREGVPTAVFEDPEPRALPAPGTGDPRPRNPMMMQFGGGAPEPKGKIQDLWDMLGIQNTKGRDEDAIEQYEIVWQHYNPYSGKLGVRMITDQWVFISPAATGANNPFGDDPVTSGLEELLFLFPGSIRANGKSKLQYTPLAKTGTNSGTILVNDFRRLSRDPESVVSKQGRATEDSYTVAARLTGKLPPKKRLAIFDEQPEDKTEEDGKEVNVIYVADVDFMSSDFVRVRARPDERVNFQFDNVTFLLNIVDSLAGDERFIAIRSRKTRHSTLKVLEEYANEAFEKNYNEVTLAQKAKDKAIGEIEAGNLAAEQKAVEAVKKLDEQRERGVAIDIDAYRQAKLQEMLQKQRGEVVKENLIREENRKLAAAVRANDTKTNQQINRVRNWIKFLSVALPPILPLFIGVVVFLRRRLREREGMSKKRLRW